MHDVDYRIKLGEYKWGKQHIEGTGSIKKSQLRRYRRSVKWISTVVLLLAVTVFFGSLSLRSKNKEYAQQEAELKAQIAEQQERSEQIEAYKEYIQSDEYIKKVAREKLKLALPGEILFEPQK